MACTRNGPVNLVLIILVNIDYLLQKRHTSTARSRGGHRLTNGLVVVLIWDTGHITMKVGSRCVVRASGVVILTAELARSGGTR